MTAFIIRRLGFAVVTLFAVLTLVFVLVRIVPGDPALVFLGDQAGREAIEAFHHKFGLDQPIWRQYFDFLFGALQGNWGESMKTGAPVLSEVMKVLPWTLELTAVSLVIGLVIGVPLGVWAALYRNRFLDYLIRITSLFGMSFPPFVSAIILILIFAIWLKWLPVISASSGNFTEWFKSMALPAVNLGLITAAYITRVTRSAMLEVLAEDYVRTAKAKGLRWAVVVWQHAFRNGLMPIITITGLYMGMLIGNSVINETVFNRPGLGKLIIGALMQRD